eukprot:jgi/Ulvmu1/811/UM010_0185.1
MPTRTSQRTTRKRQRQACLEDTDLARPLKQQATDENAAPANGQTKAQQRPLQARRAVGKGSNVLCRQEEVSKLKLALLKCINDNQGAAIYVPGQPGTGKTHTVRTVVSSLGTHGIDRALPTCTLVNCQDASSSLPRVCLAALREAQTVMSKFKSSGSTLLPIVAGDACKLPSACSNYEASKDLKALVSCSKLSAKRMNILILDELDQACKATEDAVQQIFSLSALPSSRLIVIGIANRLDLAHRVLQPTGASPTVISFHSYTAKQLLQLLQAQFPNTFETKALELVARRVSAVSGDMRSAIAVCASARATAARATPATAPLATKGADSQSEGAEAVPPQLITVSQIATALANCKTGGGAEAQAHIKLIQELPVQQQLLVCTLAIARGGAAGASVSATPAASSTLATSRSALTCTPRPALSTACTPRQGNLHSLLTPQSRTPVGAGFGLATPRPATKPVFKSFPMPDDLPGQSPSTITALARGKGKGAASTSAQMSMEAVYRKYTTSGKEAGIAVVDWPGLEMLVGLLCETGLLEVTAAKGKARGRQGAAGKGAMVKLKVGTDDVKHALASSRMLMPLVSQLP